MTRLTYLQLPPGVTPPDVSALSPFRTVLIAEAEASPEWQATVSQWLVRAGCLYTMAWGASGSSWDTAVDLANIEQFDYKEIPEDALVMTTWHDNEPLEEVFWFSKNNGFHPTVELTNTLLLHIAYRYDEQAMLATYATA